MQLNIDNSKNLLRLPSNINFKFYINFSSLFLTSSLGIIILRLPSYYFYKLGKNNITFLFNKYFLFRTFFKQIELLSSRLFLFYFFKLRIRGLGFRVRGIFDILYYFFFNYTNYMYIYPPNELVIRVYKKRVLLLSFNWFLLKKVLSHILLLRKIGPYSFLGFRYKHQIILLKKSGKKV